MSREDEVEALAQEFFVAMNHRDAHAIAALFTEDAEFTNVVGASVRGRAAIEELHAPVFAGPFRRMRISTDRPRVRWLSGGLGSVELRWIMTGALDSAGQERPPRRGLLHWIVQSNGSRWAILVSHNAEFPRPV
jgi:uncharacterized protein (TIGR02246 family)